MDDNACFLCGCVLSDDKTEEHVFPKWLQRKHNLWDKELGLLNQTFIKYRQLRIPCCSKCNNEYLGSLEIKIEKAFRAGYEEVVALSEIEIYQWAGKIFYGILRKELQLYADVKNKEAGFIVPPELLESFSSLHMFLQSIRRPFIFPEGYHFTSLVVNLHKEDFFGDYDFMDNLHCMVVALKSENVGIIISLQDAGIIRSTYAKYVQQVNGRKLVFPQFIELYSKVLYQNYLLNRTPKFVIVANEKLDHPIESRMLPLAGLSSVPVINDWDQEHYAYFLAGLLEQRLPNYTFEKIFSPPDQVMSWMVNNKGELVFYEDNGNTTTELVASQGPANNASL